MTTSTQSEATTFRRSDLAIRPAREGDRAAIEAIAAQVWDGHDYLPQVLEEWLADREGLFCVATVRGLVVGTGKLTRLDADQWWLEGLRVAPPYRGRGIGRVLHHYLVNQARRRGPGTLRFSTGSGNEAVHKLAGETAFRQVAAFVPCGAPAEAYSTAGLAALGLADADRAWAFLQAAPHFEATRRTLEERWRFLPLTQERLTERLAAGLVYGWLGTGGETGEALVGLAVLGTPRRVTSGEDEETRLCVGYMDALPGEWIPLARALRGLAATQGHPRVSVKALRAKDVLGALSEAGYERRLDMDVLLFERDLSLTAHASVHSGE